ncbi:phosphatase PAP2 family protein [Bacillus sp. UMB0728]|uniref:phosphatase PAP2 family protein n=1 Tax=Bacillus sp. UMB0728 TaxID=2066052 RepID=UPI000C79168D|nr:phosphatase PAP2 family protein [Bacillus sp. UMB0728]PLR70262.1 phosphatase PAP2 family protein [Bacillus sp. UMB0728]
MKLKGHLLSAFLIGLVSLIGFSCMAILISAQKIERFDQTLISFIRGYESQALTTIMKFFTFIGSFPVVLVLFLIVSFILYSVLRCRAEVFLLGTVIIGTQVINQTLKVIFHRARPDFHLLIDVGGYSFPSGHAMSAFAVYGILAFIFWRHILNRFGRTTIVIFSSLLILIIGTSRIYLGVHYPSDIIGGYFASSVWLTVSIWFFQRYKEKEYTRTNLYKNKGIY